MEPATDRQSTRQQRRTMPAFAQVRHFITARCDGERLASDIMFWFGLVSVAYCAYLAAVLWRLGAHSALLPLSFLAASGATGVYEGAVIRRQPRNVIRIYRHSWWPAWMTTQFAMRGRSLNPAWMAVRVGLAIGGFLVLTVTLH